MSKNRQWMKKSILIGAVSVVMIFATACSSLDVIGNDSVKAFEQVITTIPEQVVYESDENIWTLEAPDGTTTFQWSDAYDKTDYDVSLTTDITPFVEAGLDVSLLPEGIVKGDKLIVGVDIDKESTANEDIPLAAYETFEKSGRDLLGFHTPMGHFGIDMGNASFEWAQDIEENDKDIVFVLDPQFLMDAGVNPDKVEGWKYAAIEAMTDKGKSYEVYKFLKPFSIDVTNE